jgi:hypothetical protein
MNNNFKLGNRVICTDNYGRVTIGMKGTVVEIKLKGNDWIGVNWDKLITGHSCNKHCKKGKGYYLPKENIKLIVPTLKTFLED